MLHLKSGSKMDFPCIEIIKFVIEKYKITNISGSQRSSKKGIQMKQEVSVLK